MTSSTRWRACSASRSPFATKGMCPSTSSSVAPIPPCATASASSPPIRFEEGLGSSSRRSSTSRCSRDKQREQTTNCGARRGPAGMSAAWRLSELGYPVTVFERDDAVGGMGRTIDVAGGYLVDFGPHTFHIRETDESREVHRRPSSPFFGEDPLVLTRGTRVLLRGKEYIYPLELLQVLTGVSPLLSARIVFDYVMATIKTTFCAAAEGTLVRRVGRAQPRTHAVRPVLRHLLRARVGPADRPDLVEAGAARRQAEPEEHHPARARASRRTRPRTSRSTCIRAAASACCSRAWRTRFGGAATVSGSVRR